MKKNKFITKLFLSCLTLSAGLLLSDHAFATSTEATTQEKFITEYSQKLSQLKETKQHFSDQKAEKNNQLSSIEKKIQKIQIDLDQLEKIESIGTISEASEPNDDISLTLATDVSPLTVKEGSTAAKKEQLTELKQKQVALKLDTKTISKQESEATKQETQLSEKIAQVNKQKTEQAKQTDVRSAIVTAAKTHLGKPYVYGAAGPDAFDCSGLVQVAFASAGRSIGRTTVDQETAGATISVSEAQAGDLVFWGSHGGTYHVGISTGDGSYIHAPVPGDVVQVATVASYAPDFAVRVL
ncbi:peptidoglycan DL-endopeptidase CwlO [Enterococcus sp. DIV0840]|uniref:C40 family peptidase n=1 Tax=Enterococcus TaxID=1350 RepID=UPI001A8CDD48|nr:MULTISPECIES: C40 family peptidase [Enterococcus]MBO0434283.1 C40 family peptidase [Enterococcus sp. DIV0849a]MBO0473592.1 C40 family peptidase [Enterococcus ureasiticus]